MSIQVLITVCYWILENSSKSHMKYGIFMHVFLLLHVYVFVEYFLGISTMNSTQYYEIS